jgi:hypothetical protein
MRVVGVSSAAAGDDSCSEEVVCCGGVSVDGGDADCSIVELGSDGESVEEDGWSVLLN